LLGFKEISTMWWCGISSSCKPVDVLGPRSRAPIADHGCIVIDQLCIDQKNKTEKSVSVAAMDTLYRSADWVIIALLDIEVHLAQQAFLRDFIKDYEDPAHEFGATPHWGESPPYFQKHPVFPRFFYTIFQSRWFTRAWCSHEMELGENHIFYVPCQPLEDTGDVNELFSFTATFLWDMLVLSAEIPQRLGPPKR